jgi:hypothetical protein
MTHRVFLPPTVAKRKGIPNEANETASSIIGKRRLLAQKLRLEMAEKSRATQAHRDGSAQRTIHLQ